MRTIRYKGGYEYVLQEDYEVQLVHVVPPSDVKSDFIEISKLGVMRIKKGYAWDGPSGPAIDTRNFMRGSLIHDCCYQLIREGHLSMEFKKPSDLELQRICLEDGMSTVRAWWVYLGVKFGGTSACRGKGGRPTLSAP